jgi:hypothetical protein
VTATDVLHILEISGLQLHPGARACPGGNSHMGQGGLSNIDFFTERPGLLTPLAHTV